MRSKRLTATTIKIAQPIIGYIDKNSEPEESVDSVLRRGLGLKNNGKHKAARVISDMKTVKVSREVMNHILNKAHVHESRDQTLGRLLGIKGYEVSVRKT